jgi:VanZ family protein
LNRRSWLPPLLWAALILVLTSIPVPGNVIVPGGDKTAHVLMYGVLGFLSARAARRSSFAPSSLIVVVLAIAVFAAIDEAHQLAIPGRSADRLDWYADVVGASLGACLALLESRGRERVR